MRVTIQKIKNELEGFYPAQEIQGFIRLIFSHYLNLSSTQMILQPDRPIEPVLQREIEMVITRLKKYEPIQYILNETEFYGLKLTVNPHVLIPRPETEELVDWILKSPVPVPTSVIDIGTGSGCIALALKKFLPHSEVLAVDISGKALETAGRNAEALGLHIDLRLLDLLSKPETGQWFNLIVSNPPYVRSSERMQMLPNVTKYEPPEALFVPDEDPLLFYRSIIEFSDSQLIKGGWIYFEINEALGQDISRLLDENGFSAIEIKKDLNGKERMARCMKPTP